MEQSQLFQEGVRHAGFGRGREGQDDSVDDAEGHVLFGPADLEPRGLSCKTGTGVRIDEIGG